MFLFMLQTQDFSQNHYRPRTKFAKVKGYVFTSVCLSTGGGSASVHAGIADPPQEQITPPRAVHAGRYGQQTGGTHPTGMHTCFNYEYIFMINNVIWVPWFCGCSSKCVNALTSVWSARSVHYEIVIMRDFLKVNY